MVYIAQNQPNGKNDGESESVSLRDSVADYIDYHAELELIDTPQTGLTFRYIPPDVELRRPDVHQYLHTLNRELYKQIAGQRFLFFGGQSPAFYLRIHYLPPEPPRQSLIDILEMVLHIGRETDAAMRAAAFSH